MNTLQDIIAALNFILQQSIDHPLTVSPTDLRALQDIRNRLARKVDRAQTAASAAKGTEVNEPVPVTETLQETEAKFLKMAEAFGETL